MKLNSKNFKSSIEQYIDYVNRSRWLDYREGYKFRFGRWIVDNVDFQSQDDVDILNLCLKSQEQEFRQDSGEKGINFIKGDLAYKESFIRLEDISILRALYDGENFLMYEGRPSMSYPKFSIWMYLV